MLSNIFCGKRKAFIAPAILIFIALNGWILRNAPVKSGDTHHYIDAVDELYEHQSITKRNQNYSGYVIFLGFCRIITPNGSSYLTTSITLQTFVSFLAMIFLYALGVKTFSLTTAALSTIFFSLNYYSLFWNQYVLTDSLFISFVIIACSSLVLSFHDKRYLAVAIPVVIFTAMLRPNGLIYLPIFVIYLASMLKAKTQIVIYIFIAISMIIGASFLSSEFNKATNRIQALDNLEGGTLIWNQKSIPMPELKDRSGNVLKDSLNYIIDYPTATAKLALSRIYVNYFFARDGYSDRHVIFLKIALPIFYFLAFMGLIKSFITGIDRGKLMLVGVIMAQTIIFAGAYADYDPRFLCYIISLIALFSFYGFGWIVNSLFPGSQLDSAKN